MTQHSAASNNLQCHDEAGLPVPQVHEAIPFRQSRALIESTTLLGSTGQLIIRHAGRDYCLRLTRSGRLILTA